MIIVSTPSPNKVLGNFYNFQHEEEIIIQNLGKNKTESNNKFLVGYYDSVPTMFKVFILCFKKNQMMMKTNGY